MKSDNIIRKFVEVKGAAGWEIETENGWVDIVASNKTIPYETWEIETSRGKILNAADTHIIIGASGEEIFVHESGGADIRTVDGIETVVRVNNTGVEKNMYDLTVNSDDHTYYSNGILSHNTETSAAYLLWYAMFNDNSNILIASKTGADALDIMSRVRSSYENLPNHIRAGVREYNKKSMVFDNGSKIESTTTTENTGRGKALSLIYLDEFAFVDPPRVAKELWTSLSPTLSTGGRIIVTSTPNSDLDQFASIWFEAEQKYDDHGDLIPGGVGRNGFGSFKVTWAQHPDRDEKWANAQISEIGEERFKREHCAEFIVFEETLVSSLKLAKIKSKEPLRRSGHVRWYKKINPEMTYAVTLDPSMGTGGDNAAITIWEMPTMEQVGEWCHNTTPIEGQMRVFKDILEEIWDQGNPDIYWSLETNSVGEAAMVIIRDTGQENFPGTFVHEPRSDGGPRKKRGFVTTQRTKRIACARIKHWIESDKMKLNSGMLINEFKNYIAKSNTYMAKQGCTDDLISSALIFIRLAEVVAKWNEDIYEAVKGDLNDSGGYDEEDPDFKQPLPVLM